MMDFNIPLEERGKIKRDTEDRLLNTMFNGYGGIVYRSSSDPLRNNHFKFPLEDVDYIRIREDEDVKDMYGFRPDKGFNQGEQKLFNTILLLDALIVRNLVECKYYVSCDSIYGSGDKTGETYEFYLEPPNILPVTISWISQSIYRNEGDRPPLNFMLRPKEDLDSCFYLKQVEYSLTDKGYQFAFDLQKHKDEKQRHLDNVTLTDRAFIAAFFIAFGAIINSVLGLFNVVRDDGNVHIKIPEALYSEIIQSSLRDRIKPEARVVTTDSIGRTAGEQ